MSAGAGGAAERYELGPVIGHGGSALVHRAWDRRGERPVALKIFGQCDGRQAARVRRECEVLAAVHHPALVTVLDHGNLDDHCFVAMPLVNGDSLDEVLRDNALSTARAIRIGVRLAAALAAVHERGFVHRDVKPSNVLLDHDGEAHLTDFGIARVTDAAGDTPTGEIVGTAAYMAPEQVRGRVVGPAADVYSLGLVLLEAVVGHREYPGGIVESAVARLSRPPHIPAAVPPPLGPLLATMTATDPEDRPSSSAVTTALSGADVATSAA